MSNSTGAIEAKLRDLPDDPAAIRQRIDLLNELGWSVRDTGDWKRLLTLSDEASELAHVHAYKRGLAASFRNAAFAHYMLASYKCALAEALISVKMAEEIGDKEYESHARVVIGLVEWSVGSYDEALRELFRALHIAEERQDAWGMAWCYTTIGSVYQNIRDYDEALLFHEKSFQIFARKDNRLGEARALTGIGTVYQALGRLGQALVYYTRSLEMFRSIHNRVGESRALNDLGTVYQEQGKDDRAFQLLRESLRIRAEDGNREAQTTSLLNLGRLHLKRGETDEALEAAGRALDIAEDIGARPKIYQAHQLLAEACEKTGDYARALRHFRSFDTIKEQVFSEEQSTRLRNLQINMEVERSQKEAEIHRLKNVELKDKNEQLARLLAELQATQAQLVQTEKMAALGDLVAAVAHEINSPLGTIQSASDIAARCAERIIEAIEGSESAERLKSQRSLRAALTALQTQAQVTAKATERIARIIGSLRSFAGPDQADFQKVDLRRSLEDALTLLEPKFRDRVSIVRQFGYIPEIFCYPAELNQAFMNLLRNAAEAIEDKGTIAVATFTEEGVLHIKVADTGRGIPPEQLARIFNPGFTTKDARVKASMSLFTSLNIVQKHRGEIRVESEVGRGTTFTVMLLGLNPGDAP